MVLKWIFRQLLPTKYISFNRLPQELQEAGIKYVIIDKDDTLCRQDQWEVQEDRRSAVQQMHNAHIQMFIVSNGYKHWNGTQPATVLGIPILKPQRKKPFNNMDIANILSDKYNIDISLANRDRTAVVGDRLMTDVLLANRMKCKSYLVPPIQQTNTKVHGWRVCLLRKIQNAILSYCNIKIDQ